ncbi:MULTISPECIES: DinB family protein [Crateriforma]|uniref:DinB superfamily protein n=1 Tax=Crateriforma conspicua TaxID=2527996 RepID=A0A5C6FHV7_9PLAN|nr:MULTISPECIES: DinB family protein [Crateriforma]TWU61825.1 DinB superfamily protein [Crateriforma conspicua]
MSDIRSLMTQQFENEIARTRQVLDVVTDALLDYQASPTMRSVRWNVSHLVDVPSWAEIILKADEFDVAPPDGPPHETPEMATMADAMNALDKNVAEARTALASFDVQSLDADWSLKAGGQTLMTMSRYETFQMFEISHVAHHRGHLLVYLRMNGVETPLLYGG